MQETPHKTSQHIDRIIDYLNLRWNLQIPRIRGDAAVRAGDGSDLGKKCSSRIRALCWNENVNMKSVIEEFEDNVQHKYSHWIWKPSQVPGTLPSLPATKSFLKRDAISKAQAITPQRRQIFLKALSALLEEEYKLATESDQYQRTPSGSIRDVSRQKSLASNRSVPSGSFATAEESRSGATNTTDTTEMRNASNSRTIRPASLKKREASQITTASSKRAKTAAVNPTAKPTPKTEKRQQSLDYMIRRQDGDSSESTTLVQSTATQLSEPDQVVTTSFATNTSEEPDRVFSEPESSTPHSNATSFMSVDSNDNDRRFTEISGTQYSVDSNFDEDVNNDINVQRSFTEAENPVSPTTAIELLSDLPKSGPFKHVQCPLPSNLSYWFTFELYRISQAYSLDVKDLWKMLRNKYGKEQLSVNEFWQAVKDINQEIRPDQEGVKVPLPAKSTVPEWVSYNDSYCDSDSGNSVSFTAKLDFSKNSTGHAFNFGLKPIKYEKSCRFHRHFGADRFLTVDMPYYSQQSLEEHTKNMAKGRGELSTQHHIIFEWLTTNDLHIAGRIWRAFYVEPIKVRSKKKREEEKPRQRLHLFAVDGFDFVESRSAQNRPISLLEFIGWHLPLKHNHRSTDMKLFARIQLGLSRTLPTIVLEPYEFIHAPDVPAQDERGCAITDGTIMTDGCARMSYQLACAVWALHEKPGQDMPSVFQARIGGAKGVWQVDYSNAHPHASERDFWIEVRDSQLKIKPHPATRRGADRSQRTFEVVKFSSPCVPGHLNIQLINIMHYCGVPRSAFKEALNTDLAEYLASLKDAMHDPLKLRVWRQLNHRASSDAIEFCGGMPDGKEDELDYLLESGFEPKSCRYLNDCLKSLLKQELDSYVDKLRIQIDASTTVFCVPDPLGILAPGEIQLNFSTSKIDPRTKLPEMHLESPRVLVARNPAHLASDIQLVKAVYYHELRHLKDVVIFPIKGRYPLADLLSGGDYDGDAVTVIWDPHLTEKFRNHSKPRLATKKECNIVSQTKYVSDVFNVINPTSQQIESFLRNCLSLNGVQSKLGRVTVEHEKLIYADHSNLGKAGPEKLAALASYLVDSAKQGDSFSDDNWYKLQSLVRKTCITRPLQDPAYKSKKDARPRLNPQTGECWNIVDYLKFDVALGLREKVLAEFKSDWAVKATDSDDDLRYHYSHERERAVSSELPEHKAITKILDDLCRKIRVINEEWQRRCSRFDNGPLGTQLHNAGTQNDFAQVVGELADRIHAIEPLDLDCDIRRDFGREGGGKGTRWSLLRASCVHYRHQTGSFPWKMVGDELCTIKARAHPCGRTWEMTLAARQIMKADAKRYRRLNEDEESVVEEFYDAED